MTDCVQSVQTYLSTLPAATRLCLVANATLFCLQSLGFVTAVGMCTHPAAALGLEGGGSSSFQPWRLFTPAWFHGGLLHIAMNMSALTGMGPALERILGSLHTALLLLALATFGTLLSDTLCLGAAGAGRAAVALGLLAPGGAAARWLGSWLYECSIGFSGVLFALLVLIVDAQGPGATQSLFGVVRLPARLYPWALLALLQVIMPHISFVGHLSGILAGHAALRLGVAAHTARGVAALTALEARAAACCAPFDALRRSGSGSGGDGGGGGGGYVPVGGDVLFGVEMPFSLAPGGGGGSGGAAAQQQQQQQQQQVELAFRPLGEAPPPSFDFAHRESGAMPTVPAAALSGAHSACGTVAVDVPHVHRAALGWQCSACTFANDPNAHRCSMCSMPRPVD
jgi:membrane associated rhomboid family serine protease